MRTGSKNTTVHFHSLHKLFVFLTAAVLYLVSSTTLRADLIHLKDGKIIEGFFNSQDGNELVFDTYEGKIRIPAGNVTSMEVGYTGIPVCYRTVDAPEINCEAVLHSVSTREALIVPERGSLNRQKIPMNRITYLKFHKENGNQNIIPILSRSLKLRVMNGDTIEGTITRLQSSSLTLVRDDGVNMTYNESDLHSAYIFIPGMEPAPELKFRYTKVLPGLYQLTQERYWTGGTILFLMAAAAGGGASETYLANHVDDDANKDGFWPFINTESYQNRFERHMNNQRAIGAAAAAIYLYHLYDVRIWQLEPDQPFKSLEGSQKSQAAFWSLHIDPDMHANRFDTNGLPGGFFGLSLNFRF